MVAKVQFYKVSILLFCLFSIPLRAVTVGPALCPTNKIAPHRRLYASDYVRGRTFGAFYDLLVPNGPSGSYDPTNDLQEIPQFDPDDCGDIEDYDENDLSSKCDQCGRGRPVADMMMIGECVTLSNHNVVAPQNITPQSQRRMEYRKDRFFFRPQSGGSFGIPSFGSRPPYNPTSRPPYVPSTRPPPMARPPYWSGGVFGSNGYRPPLQQNPSDFIKPIHEYSEFEQMTYRPDLVGAPLGHIVGASPIRPTTSEDRVTTNRPFYPPNRIRYTTPSPDLATRRSRPRNINNNGIFGSFFDLIFK